MRTAASPRPSALLEPRASRPGRAVRGHRRGGGRARQAAEVRRARRSRGVDSPPSAAVPPGHATSAVSCTRIAGGVFRGVGESPKPQRGVVGARGDAAHARSAAPRPGKDIMAISLNTASNDDSQSATPDPDVCDRTTCRGRFDGAPNGSSWCGPARRRRIVGHGVRRRQGGSRRAARPSTARGFRGSVAGSSRRRSPQRLTPEPRGYGNLSPPGQATPNRGMPTLVNAMGSWLRPPIPVS
jgi:hypothetical protein